MRLLWLTIFLGQISYFSHIFLNRISLIIEAKVDHLGNTFFNRRKTRLYFTLPPRGNCCYPVDRGVP